MAAQSIMLPASRALDVTVVTVADLEIEIAFVHGKIH
jgi:hypothetical protein